MNIFILDENPKIAASYHCDKHVLKMILESGQMLCTAHWLGWLDYLKKDIKDFKTQKEAKEFLYNEVPSVFQPEWKMTHINHPCSVWTRESLDNYVWHSRLGLSLCEEYKNRYGKIHKSSRVHRWLYNNHPPRLESKGQSPFSICMLEDYKISDDPVDCYREYYLKDKVRFAKWKKGNFPPWWVV